METASHGDEATLSSGAMAATHVHAPSLWLPPTVEGVKSQFLLFQPPLQLGVCVGGGGPVTRSREI